MKIIYAPEFYGEAYTLDVDQSVFDAIMEARQSMREDISLRFQTQYGFDVRSIPEKHLHLIH